MTKHTIENALSPSEQRAVLRALQLPDEAILPLLDHLETFCRAHGHNEHYEELMALVARQRAVWDPS